MQHFIVVFHWGKCINILHLFFRLPARSLSIIFNIGKHRIHMVLERERESEYYYFLLLYRKMTLMLISRAFESSRHQRFPFYLHTDNSISFEWFIQHASSAFKFIEWNKWRLKCAWKWKWKSKWIFSKRLEQLFRSPLILFFRPCFLSSYFILSFPFSFGEFFNTLMMVWNKSLWEIDLFRFLSHFLCSTILSADLNQKTPGN